MPLEDYGWLSRYAGAHDTTISQVMRKALQMFRTASVKKPVAATDNRIWGQPVRIIKNEDYENVVEINKDVLEGAMNNLSFNGFKVWYYFYKNDIGNIVYCKAQDIGVDNCEKYFYELIEKGYLVEQENNSFTFYDEV